MILTWPLTKSCKIDSHASAYAQWGLNETRFSVEQKKLLHSPTSEYKFIMHQIIIRTSCQLLLHVQWYWTGGTLCLVHSKILTKVKTTSANPSLRSPAWLPACNDLDCILAWIMTINHVHFVYKIHTLLWAAYVLLNYVTNIKHARKKENGRTQASEQKNCLGCCND